MASGGHNRKSNAAKRLAGTARKDRMRVIEGGKSETPDPVAPPPPRWLTRPARGKFTQLVPMLLKRGLLTEMSADLLANACMHWELMVTCYRQVAKDGPIVRGHRNARMKHPGLQVFRDNSSAFRECLAKMGMTPADVGKVDAVDPHDADDDFFG